MALGLFLAAAASLLAGFPVAFTLAGVALIFALLGIATGIFDPAFLSAFPSRLFGIMSNETLIAVPVFVFMGVMLERSKLADQLLQALAQLMRRVPGGLGLAVMMVGTLMAASTGIVGATVVTMGLLSLPTMLKHKYDPSIATGSICAAGTLGQIIPPSIVLILLADNRRQADRATLSRALVLRRVSERLRRRGDRSGLPAGDRHQRPA